MTRPLFTNPVPGPRIVPRGKPRLPTDKLANGRDAFRVTSTYAEHAASKRGLGADIGNYQGGDPVLAMASGRVSVVNPKQGEVRIDHGEGWSSGYGHMADLEVAVGDRVERYQQLGLVGRTGTAELHLHFDISEHGVRLDPIPLLEQSQIGDDPVALATCWVGAGNNLRKQPSMTARAHLLTAARMFDVLEYQPAGGQWVLPGSTGHDWIHLRDVDPEGWWIARPLASDFLLSAAGRLLLPPADCSALEARIDRGLTALAGATAAIEAATASLKES
ncbi:MAG: M23 family metallopeptidase [Chloroflexi bacterium]|nr:M23 family metallopeptidase [Chloroflexota bacterium]